MSSESHTAEQPLPRRDTAAGWARDPFTWLSGALVVAALAGLAQLFGGVIAPVGEAPPEIRGVPFGATAPEVRERFAAPGEGRWRAFDDGDVHVLEWRGQGRDRYRFELHAGLLVAVRATVPDTDPWAAGDRLDATAATVVTRAPEEGGVAVTILSRDCPAHAAEVKRLLAQR